jgi:peroxiredoxin
LDVDGKEINVDYKNDPRKAVLLVFSPRCKFCTKNMPNWREIIKRLDQNSHRLIAVSLVSEGVREYVAQQGLSDVPVIAEMAPVSKQSYHMTATPQTVLIDSQGRVEKVWSGVIEPGAWHDLEQSLALRP